MGFLIIPVCVFGIVALVMGIILAVASKLFAIQTDPREEMVGALLPGANCGGCGYAGCGACAVAMVKGEAKVSACPSLSAENFKKVCKIIGVQASASEPKAALVHCEGTMEKANYKYYFDGSKRCADIAGMQGGDKLCEYACLGYGDCVEACSFHAIEVENGIAKISREKCAGCGVCVDVCPKRVISLIPKTQKVVVKCSSCDKGAAMKEKCSAGCIGCKICEKTCPEKAITVENNLAKINGTLCTGCGACVEKCPKKIIVYTNQEHTDK